MSKLLELKEKRNQAWQQAKTFLDSVRSEDGLVSEEDSKRYDDMEAKINLYNQEIARLERQEKIDLELSQPASQALIGQPTTVLNVKTTEEEKKGVASAMPRLFGQVFVNVTSLMSRMSFELEKIPKVVIWFLMSMRRNWFKDYKKRISSAALRLLSKHLVVSVRFLL